MCEVSYILKRHSFIVWQVSKLAYDSATCLVYMLYDIEAFARRCMCMMRCFHLQSSAYTSTISLLILFCTPLSLCLGSSTCFYNLENANAKKPQPSHDKAVTVRGRKRNIIMIGLPPCFEVRLTIFDLLFRLVISTHFPIVNGSYDSWIDS